MGVKDGFMRAPMLVKEAFILLVVANLFSWIAFTTTSWGFIDLSPYPGYGLWRACNESGDCSLMDGTRLDWFGCFQAFGIFGFVGLSVALLLVILFMFVGSCKGNEEVSMGTIICCFVGAVCWLISVIIFAAKFKKLVSSNSEREFGFSFILAIISLIIAAVAGVLMIAGGKGGGTSPA